MEQSQELQEALDYIQKAIPLLEKHATSPVAATGCDNFFFTVESRKNAVGYARVARNAISDLMGLQPG